MVKVETAGYSHKGKRSNNEDNWYAGLFKNEKIKAIAAVADGMGGMAGGEVASQIAVSFLKDQFFRASREYDFNKNSAENFLFEAYDEINRLVYEKGNATPELTGMGTTLTMFIQFEDNNCYITNLGDSRAYYITSNGITQITEDHNALSEAIKNKSIDVSNPANLLYGNALTKYIGEERAFKADIFNLNRPFDGDIILLCSDGFYKSLSVDTMLDELMNAESLEQALINLAYLSYTNGSDDNITASAIQFGDRPFSSIRRVKYPKLQNFIKNADDYAITAYYGKGRTAGKGKLAAVSAMLIVLFIIGLFIYNEYEKKQAHLKILNDQVFALSTDRRPLRAGVKRRQESTPVVPLKSKEEPRTVISPDQAAENSGNSNLSAETSKWKMSKADEAEILKSYGRSLKQICKLNNLNYPVIKGLKIEITLKKFTMFVYSERKLLKKYPVSLGANWNAGPKELKGDKKTPRGEYKPIEPPANSLPSNLRNTVTDFLFLNYPNNTDAFKAYSLKKISPEEYITIKKQNDANQLPDFNTRLGGKVRIDNGGQLDRNWTDGSISMETADFKEVKEIILRNKPNIIIK